MKDTGAVGIRISGQLSATLLEWPDQPLPSKLVNKLRDNGVFLANASPQAIDKDQVNEDS